MITCLCRQHLDATALFRTALPVVLLSSFLSVAHADPAPPVATGSAAPRPTGTGEAPAEKTIDFQDIHIRELSATLFQIGEIRFDKAARTLSFPAKVCLRDGLLEYLLVNEEGKAYESILSTTARPYDLHVAMLLLGAKPPVDAPQPPSQIDSNYLQSAPPLIGEEVEITVTWKTGNSEQRLHGEDLVFNQERNKPMTRGPWLYNGSVLHNGRLLAQSGGSIVALVTDAAALINNTRPGHTDDHIWTVNTKKLPPEGVLVQITVKLLKPKPHGSLTTPNAERR